MLHVHSEIYIKVLSHIHVLGPIYELHSGNLHIFVQIVAEHGKVFFFFLKLKQFSTDVIQSSLRFALIRRSENFHATVPMLIFLHDQELLRCEVKMILFHLAW